MTKWVLLEFFLEIPQGRFPAGVTCCEHEAKTFFPVPIGLVWISHGSVAAGLLCGGRMGAEPGVDGAVSSVSDYGGNLYYVGSKDLASYLVVTPEGNILINSSLESSVPLIKASVEKLGFRFSDTKILLISHAHNDHNAGSATVKQMTGAKYMVMDADVPVVEDGGRSDFRYGRDKNNWYKPTKVDRVLHDGDEVRLGGVVLVAHKTPGHTKGCTTWTMRVNGNGKTYDAVIVGSPNVNPGYRLAGRPSYPGIAADYEKTFRVLKSLHCDLFLGAHGGYFGLAAKYARLKAGDTTAFVDPAGYASYVTEREETFKKELVQQQRRHDGAGLRAKGVVALCAGRSLRLKEN